MAARYGKATFRDGQTAYLVYQHKEVEPPLFKTLEEAREWVASGFPRLERTYHEKVSLAKFSEQPAHVVVDLNSPDDAMRNFYTTASLAGLVITGPCSKKESQSITVDRSKYTLDTYESWVAKGLNNPKLDDYNKLKPSGKELVDSILKWWIEAQFATQGDRGEWNVFDRDPDFVTLAMRIRSPEHSERGWETATISEVAKESLDWWSKFDNCDGDHVLFHIDPPFISMAEKFIKRPPSDDLQP